MGRGRVELKRIENKINRQVTFTKRRNGLFKKACELSILCDAEVALIIFSNRGKMFEFGSPCIQKTIEHYQSYIYASQDMGPNQEPQRDGACAYFTAKQTLKNLTAHESRLCLVIAEEVENWYQEYNLLKGKYDSIQRSHRHLLGEELEPLSLRELQKLERQLESALSQTRKKKTQILLDQMEELKQKLEAAGSSDRGSASGSAPTSQPNAVDPEPILEIGFSHSASKVNPRNPQQESNFMQNWAL